MEKLTKREKLILAGGGILLVAVGFVFGKNKLKQSRADNSYNKLHEKYNEGGTKSKSYEELKEDCKTLGHLIEEVGQNKKQTRKYLNLYNRLHQARNSRYRKMKGM